MNNEISREDAVELLLSIGIDNVDKLPKTKTVTGKDVFSVLLPDDFDFIGYHKDCEKCVKAKKDKCDDDLCVFINNGKMLSGVIDKVYIGEGGGDILRTLYTQYGHEKAIDILGNISKLGIKYLLLNGFSTGLEDADISEEVVKQIQDIIDDAEKKVDVLIQNYEILVI